VQLERGFAWCLVGWSCLYCDYCHCGVGGGAGAAAEGWGKLEPRAAATGGGGGRAQTGSLALSGVDTFISMAS
jgi:hypothetical protein